MGLLRDLEDKLEKIVEGLFSRAFQARIQPVEIAKALGAKLEDGRLIGPNHTYVPNHFVVKLSPSDFEEILPYQQAILPEFESYLRSKAEKEKYTFLGPVRIVFQKDEEVKSGRLEVSATIEEGEEKEKAKIEETQAISLAEAARSDLAFAPAYLVNLETGDKSYLTSGLTRIGRSRSNDIVIADPSVSRFHAEAEYHQGKIYLKDLASTNGTQVNGKLIKEKRLSDGDIVVFGGVKFEFREVARD